jgi:uncharacterized protein (TIGR02246 family)
MNRPIFGIALVGLICLNFGCRQGKEVKKESAADIGAAREEIGQLINSWVEASNAGDADKIVSLLADDCVIIPPNAPPLIGKEAVRKDEQQSYDQYTYQGDETILDFHVCGDYAFSRGTWTQNQTPKAGGESKKQNGHFMDIYQKQSDGSWKLFMNAWSDETVASPPQEQSSRTEQVEKDIETAADTLAAAISRLDAEGVTNFFSRTPGTKYISDGTFIPQQELSTTFKKFYGGLQQMNFAFEKKEVRVLDQGMAVLTGWARYTAVSKAGQKSDEKALFTVVYVREDGTWRIFQAHKSFTE